MGPGYDDVGRGKGTCIKRGANVLEPFSFVDYNFMEIVFNRFEQPPF